MKTNTGLTDGTMGRKPVKPKKALFAADDDGCVICSADDGAVYDLCGKPIARFAGCSDTSERMYKGDCGMFSSDGEYLWLNGERVARFIRKRNVAPVIVLLILLVGACAILGILLGNRDRLSDPVIVIKDSNGSWSATCDISIFDDKRLAPGESGRYGFSVLNASRKELLCDVFLEIEFDASEDAPPLNYTLDIDGKTFSFSENDGRYEIKDLVLKKKMYRYFDLIWDWPYESGRDYEDTLIGTNGGGYKCTITIEGKEKGKNVS